MLLKSFIFLICIFQISGFSACPNNTLQSPYNNEWCYELFYKPCTWPEAEGNCLKQGQHLASIHDSKDNDFLVNYFLTNILYSSYFWIGGLRFQFVNYTWSDESIFDYNNIISDAGNFFYKFVFLNLI